MEPHDPGGKGASLPVHHFACLPLELARDPRLTAAQVRVAALLVGHAGKGYGCWPSNRTLMAASGLSRRGLQTALERLQEAGWILRLGDDSTRVGRRIDLL